MMKLYVHPEVGLKYILSQDIKVYNMHELLVEEAAQLYQDYYSSYLANMSDISTQTDALSDSINTPSKTPPAPSEARSLLDNSYEDFKFELGKSKRVVPSSRKSAACCILS